MTNGLSIIALGGLHTDITGLGVPSLISSGELAYGGTCTIGPGGKSRNIAQMIAALTERGTVAMLGKTVKDPYGLWKPPVDALIEAGVNMDFICIESWETAGKMPGIALIPVDKNGNNQIYVLPGITDDFCPADITQASTAFELASKNNGLVVMSLELPLNTAIAAVNAAQTATMKVILDPGGLQPGTDYSELFSHPIYCLKPNQQETELLTGHPITDPASMQRAARQLLRHPIEYVLLTAGAAGAYLFGQDGTDCHLPAPPATLSGQCDETGCGDQTTAALTAALSRGRPIHQAAEQAVLAGTMQFLRPGIQPVTVNDLAGCLIKGLV